MIRCAILAVTLLAAGCVPNPRNEIASVMEASARDMMRWSPGADYCVDRQIAPWESGSRAANVNPPSGFESLLASGVFRGGGGLKGDRVGGIAIHGGGTCFDARGPVISGDRAMVEYHWPGTGYLIWLQRRQGRWLPVVRTIRDYPM